MGWQTPRKTVCVRGEMSSAGARCPCYTPRGWQELWAACFSPVCVGGCAASCLFKFGLSGGRRGCKGCLLPSTVIIQNPQLPLPWGHRNSVAWCRSAPFLGNLTGGHCISLYAAGVAGALGCLLLSCVLQAGAARGLQVSMAMEGVRSLLRGWPVWPWRPMGPAPAVLSDGKRKRKRDVARRK